MDRISKGDASIQINESMWQHWCRKKNLALVLLFLATCPHCGDIDPDSQKMIDQMSVAMLRDGTA